jgi:hypothetical protein
LWTDDQRVAANRDCRLLYRGQQITDDGDITGKVAPTEALGFRWSAVNDLFVTAGDIVAADEWRAARSTDEENAEREMRQFLW